jgi:hypothetical protein
VFHPNKRYLYADSDERSKLVFPFDWDMSEANSMTEPRCRGCVEPHEIEGNKLYGDIWLLEKIADRTGLRSDLMDTFDNNKAIVDDILTVAMYLVATSHSCNRVARWQNIVKTPSSTVLTPVAITRLMQSITESNRIRLMGLRGKRLKDGELARSTRLQGARMGIPWPTSAGAKTGRGSR